MNETVRGLLGLALMAGALALPQIEPYLPNVIKSYTVVEQLQISEPSGTMVLSTKAFDGVIAKEDQALFAVFHNVLSKNIKKHNMDSQNFNDFYRTAAMEYFSNVKGKYPEFGRAIVETFQKLLTDDNHVLTDEEKGLVEETLNAIAWQVGK